MSICVHGVHGDCPRTPGKACAATPADASALLHHDPGALVFGAWDSTELGLGSKPRNRWARALTCEISATRVERVHIAGNRLDPIGIEGTEQVWVEEADGTLRQATDAELLPKDKGGLPRASDKERIDPPRLVKASEANHGNAVSLPLKGVLVHGEIRLDATLSLSRLRRYRFGEETAEGRLLLTLMGLYGVLAVLEDGLALRSGCELAVDEYRIELIGLGTRAPLLLEREEVGTALRAQARAVRLHPPVLFTPSKGLRDIRGACR